ncbi:MAG: hypothetical protein PVG22_05105 [Chromatiales bacterium]
MTDSRSSDQKVWPPGPLKETDHSTGTWQMLLPVAESSCSVFGENDLATIDGWVGARSMRRVTMSGTSGGPISAVSAKARSFCSASIGCLIPLEPRTTRWL